MKKIVSLFLVFSILALSIPLTAKERKGADLIIQKTDGQQVRGELIAVKENSLLLLERDSVADLTIDIGDIKVITIVKKSKGMLWMAAGSFAGASVGALVGLAMGDDKIPVPNRRPTIRRTAENKAFEYGVIFGAFGLTIGVIVGESISVDKVVKIEEKSDSEIQEILEKLRKKARKKNAQ